MPDLNDIFQEGTEVPFIKSKIVKFKYALFEMSITLVVFTMTIFSLSKGTKFRETLHYIRLEKVVMWVLILAVFSELLFFIYFIIKSFHNSIHLRKQRRLEKLLKKRATMGNKNYNQVDNSEVDVIMSTDRNPIKRLHRNKKIRNNSPKKKNKLKIKLSKIKVSDGGISTGIYSPKKSSSRFRRYKSSKSRRRKHSISGNSKSPGLGSISPQINRLRRSAKLRMRAVRTKDTLESPKQSSRNSSDSQNSLNSARSRPRKFNFRVGEVQKRSPFSQAKPRRLTRKKFRKKTPED
jgi:hypothetical protein